MSGPTPGPRAWPSPRDRGRLIAGGTWARHDAGGRIQVEAPVHVQLGPAAGIHVRPEQRRQCAPVRVSAGVDSLRIGEDLLHQQRVDVDQSGLEQVHGKHADLLGLLAHAGQVAAPPGRGGPVDRRRSSAGWAPVRRGRSGLRGEVRGQRLRGKALVMGVGRDADRGAAEGGGNQKWAYCSIAVRRPVPSAPCHGGLLLWACQSRMTA